jgi:hypothetical protein
VHFGPESFHLSKEAVMSLVRRTNGTVGYAYFPRKLFTGRVRKSVFEYADGGAVHKLYMDSWWFDGTFKYVRTVGRFHVYSTDATMDCKPHNGVRFYGDFGAGVFIKEALARQMDAATHAHAWDTGMRSSLAQKIRRYCETDGQVNSDDSEIIIRSVHTLWQRRNRVIVRYVYGCVWRLLLYLMLWSVVPKIGKHVAARFMHFTIFEILCSVLPNPLYTGILGLLLVLVNFYYRYHQSFGKEWFRPLGTHPLSG